MEKPGVFWRRLCLRSSPQTVGIERFDRYIGDETFMVKFPLTGSDSPK
jgi:hypothetical protein